MLSKPRNPPVPPPRSDWIPHVALPPKGKTPLRPPAIFAGDPVRRKLIVLPGVCVGCQLCELACSLTHEGVINPYLARVRVNQVREEGLVKTMEESYGKRFTRTPRDSGKELNSGVTVLVNGEAFSGWDAPLADGDQITFLFYAVGG